MDKDIRIDEAMEMAMCARKLPDKAHGIMDVVTYVTGLADVPEEIRTGLRDAVRGLLSDLVAAKCYASALAACAGLTHHRDEIRSIRDWETLSEYTRILDIARLKAYDEVSDIFELD